MIGVCDSGIGGLLLLEGIHRRYPETDILYYGDRKHMPYGSKTQMEIKTYFDDILAFYKARGVSDLIVACNTLCSCIDETVDADFRIHEIITKTIEQIDVARDKRIIVLATPLTISSGRYQNLLKKRGFNKVTLIALDDLAYDIENFISPQVVEEKLRKALVRHHYSDVGAVILACTHYPVYRDFFAEFFKTKVYDSCDLNFDLSHKKEGGRILLHLEKSADLASFIERFGRIEYQYD